MSYVILAAFFAFGAGVNFQQYEYSGKRWDLRFAVLNTILLAFVLFQAWLRFSA